ncbi:hypothetical protein [Nonomuraea insulae]|uniref:Uncharacterized protein n=1 Tax=Nonomuraea insulae TaxID=1616787 RepID=A0ABW1CN42_9ACTN
MDGIEGAIASVPGAAWGIGAAVCAALSEAGVLRPEAYDVACGHKDTTQPGPIADIGAIVAARLKETNL